MFGLLDLPELYLFGHPYWYSNNTTVKTQKQLSVFSLGLFHTYQLYTHSIVWLSLSLSCLRHVRVSLRIALLYPYWCIVSSNLSNYATLHILPHTYRLVLSLKLKHSRLLRLVNLNGSAVGVLLCTDGFCLSEWH